jgi:hypothetical protein
MRAACKCLEQIAAAVEGRLILRGPPLILSAFRLSFEARLRRAPQDEAESSRRTAATSG